MEALIQSLAESLAFGLLGLFLLAVAYFAIDMLTPGHLGKSIAHDKNMALAIVVAGAFVGVGLVIAGAIAG